MSSVLFRKFFSIFHWTCSPQVQKEYLLEDEIPAHECTDYIKVLVMGALVCKEDEWQKTK